MILIIKTIKLYQAKALIDQHNIDSLFYVDRVSVEGCMDIIFKSDLSDQLYAFWYYISDVPDLGTTIDKNLDVKVAPVKKVTKQVMVTKYVEDDSNN